LPRPRHRSIVATPRFMAMKKYCLELLQDPEQQPSIAAA
jgi:hypothetical protein